MDEYNLIPAQEVYVWDELQGLGYSDDRLSEKVNEQAEIFSDIMENREVEYISAWHFTSHRLRDSIKEKGLMTRNDTNMPAQHSAAPSHEDKIYFTTEEGYLHAGEGMADKIGGRPIAFQAYLNPDNLRIDEDTEMMHDYSGSGLDEEDFYLISLATFGNIAHEGNIYPDRESAPEGKSFLVDSKTYDEKDVTVPDPVRKQFNSRIYDAKKDRISEDPDEIIKQLDSVRTNFDTQISMSEARKILEKHRS